MANACRELASHLSNPGEEHWKSLVRAVGYVKGRQEGSGLKLRCPKELRSISYCDSNYAQDADDRKSSSESKKKQKKQANSLSRNQPRAAKNPRNRLPKPRKSPTKAAKRPQQKSLARKRFRPSRKLKLAKNRSQFRTNLRKTRSHPPLRSRLNGTPSAWVGAPEKAKTIGKTCFSEDEVGLPISYNFGFTFWSVVRGLHHNRPV